MRNAISSGMKELIGIRLYLSIGLFLIAIGIATAEELLYIFPVEPPLMYLFHIELLHKVIGSDLITSFVPIISTIPFAGSYVDEIKSKYVRLICIRSSIKNYIISRVIICYLSGIIIIATSILLVWGLLFLFFRPFEDPQMTSMITVNMFSKSIIQLILYSGFWSVVGMSISSFMESKYISYATPFVFYYLLVILYERYFSDLFVIYPKTWTDPTAWPFGCWGAAIFLLEMTLIFAFLFACRAGRRLQQL